MPQTLKVDNVDDAVIEKLSACTMKHGRTIEAEHRAVLVQALSSKSPFDELAAKRRNMLDGRPHTPSELLLRESREERC
jgi:plasmid stability protein